MILEWILIIHKKYSLEHFERQIIPDENSPNYGNNNSKAFSHVLPLASLYVCTITTKIF